MKYLIFDCGGVLVWPRPGDWSVPYGVTEILGKLEELEEHVIQEM